jgi:hypothetical protein
MILPEFLNTPYRAHHTSLDLISISVWTHMNSTMDSTTTISILTWGWLSASSEVTDSRGLFPGLYCNNCVSVSGKFLSSQTSWLYYPSPLTFTNESQQLNCSVHRIVKGFLYLFITWHPILTHLCKKCVISRAYRIYGKAKRVTVCYENADFVVGVATAVIDIYLVP